jgi:hypothetical protein
MMVGEVPDGRREDATRLLARRTLERQRPEELEIFELLAPQFEEAARTARLRPGDEPPLAFGLSEVVELVTPVVVTLSMAAVVFLKEVARSTASAVLQRQVEDWLAQRREAPDHLELPPETLTQLRTRLERGLADRFPGIEVEGVVDHVIAALVTPASRHDPDR